MSYALTCCSTADMPEEYFKSRNIPLICFHFRIEENEYDDDLGKSISFSQFYQMIADGAKPITAQPNAQQYIKVWEPYLQNGQDILHLTLSSGISGAINSALIAKSELEEKYPERKICVIDSLAASSGYGLLVDQAADLRDEGLSLEESALWIKKHRLYVHHWFFSTDLTSFLRGGRINNVEHFLGTALKLCPLMNVNNEGKLIPRQKIRTKHRAIDAMVDKMKEHAENGINYHGKCILSHSACEADAKAVAKKIEELFPQLKGKVIINSIGTVIGSHTGPGTVALFFIGDERED